MDHHRQGTRRHRHVASAALIFHPLMPRVRPWAVPDLSPQENVQGLPHADGVSRPVWLPREASAITVPLGSPGRSHCQERRCTMTVRLRLAANDCDLQKASGNSPREVMRKISSTFLAASRPRSTSTSVPPTPDL